MSSLMSGELQATCSALGYSDGDKYYIEPDCTYALKDLIRYLKHDDENHTVRRELGNMKIMVTDLLPLLKNFWEDKTILDIVLRLLVNLTNPALILYEEIPTDRILRNHYLEIIHHLQCYKQAFAEEKIFVILTSKLGKLLQLDWENRREEDRLIIERILILVRNVLHIPPDPQQEKRTDNDATVHDQVLWCLHTSGMEDILLYVASSKEENNLCVHVIEIISLMFREQDASQLAVSGLPRSECDKRRDDEELEKLRQQEAAEKQKKLAKFNGLRHSRFGGTYTVKNLKSISNNELICHTPIAQTSSLSFDRNKSITKRPRNRVLALDTEVSRKSTLNIRLCLKEFCIEFLKSSYNSIMSTVKDSLVRQKAEDHDETYYMWAMRFFMEFNRGHQFRVDLVSETISLPTFHFVQNEIDKNLEMIRIEKKKTQIWAKRLHFSAKAYAELINTLVAMGNVKSPEVCESLKVLKGNIFYLTEYRELPLLLLKSYDEIKMPKSYLKDIVEVTHIFLKLLQDFSKGSSHLIVKVNKKKRNVKKKKQNKVPEVVAPNLEDKWETIANDVSAAVQGQFPLSDDVQPFDAASEKSMEQQCADTMRRIQFLLREANVSSAVALFRAAREIWPEDGAFGTLDIEPDKEFLALREIFFAPLPDDSAQTTTESTITADNVNEMDVQDDEEDDDDDEQEEAEVASASTAEHEFNYQDFVQRFASTSILQPYAYLLRNFASNSMFTNHCIAKMFHRVAWDLKKPGLLYQATVFRSLQKIFEANTNGYYKELARLGKYILENFFQTVKNNNKIFMEILFWKKNAEVFEIEHGYGTYDTSKTAKQLWTEEQEDELRRLYEEYKDGATDVVDTILDHLIDKTKTRRQVIAQLKRQDLITCAKQLTKRPSGRGKRATLNEEEIVELRQLFEQYRESCDILQDIQLNFTANRSKDQITKKLLELGLVKDKKELRKKRIGKKQSNKSKIPKKSNQPNLIEKEVVELPSDSSSDGSVSSSDEYEDDIEQENISSLTITPKVKNAVEWLRDTLKEASEDRADGTSEPTAIVPFVEDITEAFNDSNFVNILRKFTLSPPEDGQESFWRIPSQLTSSMLNKRVWYLDRMLNGEITEQVTTEESFQMLKAKRSRSQKHIEREINSQDEISADKNQKSPGEISIEKYNRVTTSPEINKSRRKNKNVLDSSDDETPLSNSRRDSNSDSASNSQIRTLNEKNSFVNNKSKRILRVEDDSSDDDLISIPDERSTDNANNTASYKRRLLDDDDDSDNKEQSSYPSKRVCYVAEDSDEETEKSMQE